MSKEFRLTSLGQLAVTLKFDKLFLTPATDYFIKQKEIGKEPSYEELVEVTKTVFPKIAL